MVGMAASTLLTGFVIDYLQAQHALLPLEVYRLIFVCHTAVGFLKLVCSLCISSQVGLHTPSALLTDTEIVCPDDETRALLYDNRH